MSPIRIKKLSLSELAIDWDDGHKGSYTFGVIRRACPCAGCKTELESREGQLMLPVIVPGQFELKTIEPVGSYALQFIWGDGHKTGIYNYELLRSICQCAECTAP